MSSVTLQSWTEDLHGRSQVSVGLKRGILIGKGPEELSREIDTS
jgi:hypothetical protein